ncbi:MAG: SIS domain-containing protein [Chloroflexi bacterium]|nr:SIS domain-containing protein [Chloroflexota bacterium]
MHLQSEIAQQPGVIKRLLDQGRAETAAVAAAIKDFNPAFACIAARGTSDNAAHYAQYMFGGLLRLPVMLATPSLHTVYETPPDLSKALVIGISQSGKAEDVRAVLEDARGQGALTLAITNFDDSPLAQTAQFHLPLLAERELSVAATKTYTAQLTVIAMLTSALAKSQAMQNELKTLPRLATQALSLCEDIADWAERYRYCDRLVTLGRGFNYATACEISLKVKELTYIASEGYSEANFRHGPIAAIDRGHPVFLVSPHGKNLAGMVDMCRQLEELGAESLIISNNSDLLRQGTQAMTIPSTPEWLSPILAVMPGQVFAMRQALARGLDVDKPRGLSKVTITE